ncbi:MAG: YidC/Oxa1 family insertase periplasmic-domain containing protein, partial [Gemmatimonadales bacterium]|nr:YidC/Oxa1 family insertase periplasmic-domain containing protein [Gemmatimonadales bacterium]
MNDRRPLIAIALILVISVAPMFWNRPAPLPVGADSSVVSKAGGPAPLAGAVNAPATMQAAPTGDTIAPVVRVPERVISVRSPLYRYGISTRGGQFVSSRFQSYTTMYPGDTLATGKRDTLELLRRDAPLLTGKLVVSGDTLHLDRIDFTASADSLVAIDAPATLELTGQSGRYTIALRYQFAPDDYRVHVTGSVTGLTGTGATLLLGLADGFRETEDDTVANHREGGVVTKLDKTTLTRFSDLEVGESRVLTGPFEWVAVKSKYFVAGLFAYDSTAVGGARGLIGAVRAHARQTNVKE